jgi:hypothetical protein
VFSGHLIRMFHVLPNGDAVFRITTKVKLQ